MENMINGGRVQFITHDNGRANHIVGAEMALRGGCRWIQLRMKGATDDEVRCVANTIMPLCRRHNATFIIDDRVELALELHADGVHLGKDDMPASQARRILGEGFIIGGTANTIEDVEFLNAEGVDYIGCGPFRFTTTKKNLAPVIGIEGYRRIISGIRSKGITLPVVAIGGITRQDIPAIMAAGVNGIALSGAIINAEDPVREMRQVLETMESLRESH